MKSTELTNYGYHAFKTGDYNAAINFFSNISSKSPSYWSGRMYLAMSYWHVGRITAAMQAFRELSEWCPDAELRAKATFALRELNSINGDFNRKKN